MTPSPVNEAGPIQKLLFVCSQNRRRSLTAEKLFEGFPAYQVRSAGTQPGARIVITEGHIGWADLIFVMEKSHLNRLHRKFPEALQGRRVITLFIPDDYDFMQPELLDELRSKLGPMSYSPTKPATSRPNACGKIGERIVVRWRDKLLRVPNQVRAHSGESFPGVVHGCGEGSWGLVELFPPSLVSLVQHASG